jgi:hypothetical protein
MLTSQLVNFIAIINIFLIIFEDWIEMLGIEYHAAFGFSSIFVILTIIYW